MAQKALSSAARRLQLMLQIWCIASSTLCFLLTSTLQSCIRQPQIHIVPHWSLQGPCINCNKEYQPPRRNLVHELANLLYLSSGEALVPSISKSTILQELCLSSNTLEGFKFRWIIPLWWSQLRPRAMSTEYKARLLEAAAVLVRRKFSSDQEFWHKARLQ